MTKPEQSGTWLASHGTYLAGQEAIDTLDLVALEMERRYGADRLRLLVTSELRQKFDRQRYLTNQATWNGKLEDVRRETARMASAWRALDKAATEAGKDQLKPEVWEIALEDGGVAAIVRSANDVGLVAREGRALQIYTLDEIARLIVKFPALSRAKAVFPGAVVTGIRQHINDPLHAIEEIGSTR